MALTPATDRLSITLKTSEGQKALIEWMSSPFTQDMLASARERARPTRPRTSDPIEVALTAGETIGANAIVDFLTQPHAQSVSRPGGAGMPQPRYGADEILKKENG